MMFFPTAYFMVVPYTESLFICLVLGSFVFAREKKWFLASLLAMFSTATRIQGLVMIPTLLIEFWYQRKEISLKKSLYLALVPLGFMFYLGINYYISGNPFEFLKIQRENYYHHNILPTTHIWELLKSVWFDNRSDTKTMIYESRLIFLLLTTGLLGFYIKKIRISYSFYSWSQIIILLTDSWLMSYPRYALALFPLFFILADIAKKDEYYEFLISFSTICMVGFFCIYCTGAWAF
jgi:Gpi18-like mannosyltransferase